MSSYRSLLSPDICGCIPEEDYRRTFNLGVGMILAVPAGKLAAAKRVLTRLGEQHFEIGQRQ